MSVKNMKGIDIITTNGNNVVYTRDNQVFMDAKIIKEERIQMGSEEFMKSSIYTQSIVEKEVTIIPSMTSDKIINLSVNPEGVVLANTTSMVLLYDPLNEISSDLTGRTMINTVKILNNIHGEIKSALLYNNDIVIVYKDSCKGFIINGNGLGVYNIQHYISDICVSCNKVFYISEGELISIQKVSDNVFVEKNMSVATSDMIKFSKMYPTDITLYSESVDGVMYGIGDNSCHQINNDDERAYHSIQKITWTLDDIPKEFQDRVNRIYLGYKNIFIGTSDGDIFMRGYNITGVPLDSCPIDQNMDLLTFEQTSVKPVIKAFKCFHKLNHNGKVLCATENKLYLA